MNSQVVNLNCLGMQCPAPILAISKAAKAAKRPAMLEVSADDGDFEQDVRAWCQSTGAVLESLERVQGKFVARIGIYDPGAAPQPPQPAPPRPPPIRPAGEVPRIELDCRGMPAPTVMSHLNRVARATSRPSLVFLRADDALVPRDIPGWCASNDVQYTLAQGDKHFVVTIALQGAPLPSALVGSTPPRSEPRAAPPRIDDRSEPRSNAGPASLAPRSAPESAPASNTPNPVLDLRRQKSEVALLLLGQRVMESERVDFVGDDPMLERHLRAWAKVIGARVECARDGEGFRGTVRLDPDRRDPATDEFDGPSLTGPTVLDQRFEFDREDSHPAEFARSAGSHSPFDRPAGAALADFSRAAGPGGAFAAADRAPVAVAAQAPLAGQPQRLNKATLMVLHNDFERLVAAFLTANACVAQGMEVEMVFTFWGVNVLRAPVPRSPLPGDKPVPLMKKMMKWMMPAGPDAQQMSKMNMGGMGVEMMKFFMKKDNILGIRQLMQQAADNGVKFTVCTMSMGVMGIEKADLMPWPNLGFGGVVSFTASARESAVSLVF